MKCLNDIFTIEGLLEEKSGLLLNRKGLFNVNQDADNRMKRIYLNFASRIGVETAGIQEPITGQNSLNSIAFEINEEVNNNNNNNNFKIKLEHEGIKIKAKSIESLEKAVEYMTCMFPYLTETITLNSFKEHIIEQNDGEVCITEISIGMQDFTIENIVANINSNKEIKFDRPYILKHIQENKKANQTTEATVTTETTVTTENTEATTYSKIESYFTQSLNKNIVLDDNFQGEIENLLLLSLRISLDNFEVCYPICSDRLLTDKNNIIFELSSSKNGLIELENNNLIFRGEMNDVNNNIKNFVYKYDELKNLYNNDLLLNIKDILNSKNDIGQIIEFLCKTNNENANSKEIITKNYSLSVLDESRIREYIDRKLNDKVILKKFNDEKEIFKLDCNNEWEVKEFIDCFMREVTTQISKGDKIELLGVLSEDLDVRSSIEKQIKKTIEEHGGICDNTKIYRSLKSGVSWIEETVLPNILSQVRIENIRQVIIKFKYFINELGEETFESESTPSYGEHLDKPNKWFDIPTRWLQELFPVDEVIANKLNMSRDDIIFERADDLSETYCIEVLDKNNNVLFVDNYDVKYVQKNYMNRYPQIGKVHVTTGWITVKKNGQTILDNRIVTDTEKVWAFIEDQLLPKLETYFLDKYGKDSLVEKQPLFNKLQINVKMSEVDYDIGIREERMSTTEAMQEDIYFYILDWFKTYGERECGKELDNIGLIIPEIENCKNQDSSVKVTLYDDYSDDAYIVENGQSKKIQEEKSELKPIKIGFKDNNINLYVDFLCKNNEYIIKKLSILQELVNEKIINLNNTENYTINFKADNFEKTLVLNPYEHNKDVITESEKQYIIENEIITYKKYMDILDYYRKYDQLKIIPLETTYKGKKIYCIEIIKKDNNVIYSHNKLLTNRITCIYNARHHGNEATSMNSSFMMVDKLLNDDKCIEKLDKINVVILPYENIDGGEIHSYLNKDNPKWLCHVARYNSAGYEFRKDYLNPNTKYGEAKAMVKLWKKWLPDIVTDNHGFEGHELYMPFSGYISPWYKSFWIPRALYYGYIWYLKTLPHMKAYGEKIQEAVVDAINQDKEIRELNDCFGERFYKYAEKWFPDMFNTEKYKDVIFYWIESSKKERACNFSLKYPEITTIDWTTEVADETAVGDYLKLNARAHLISDMALFDLLYNTEIIYETNLKKDGNSIKYSKIRRRPLR